MTSKIPQLYFKINLLVQKCTQSKHAPIFSKKGLKKHILTFLKYVKNAEHIKHNKLYAITIKITILLTIFESLEILYLGLL